ncbi:sortase [candidate division WWE3 bacterium]|uniref:Sortase n=1 Tax=candidate division WWE3 bacterium TaxID=2053526 RepID=A0A955RWQ6_UNCKA|nr:sortase [candidate division WWE3 bacterium]
MNLKEAITSKNKAVVFFLTLKTIANFFIISGLAYLFWAFYPIMRIELSYFWNNITAEAEVNTSYQIAKPVLLPEIQQDAPPLSVIPVNTQGSILIEDINVNSPIVFNVSVTDKNAYFSALEQGVAHAGGTALPSKKPGNTYLFAHSTPNPLEIKKYGAVFTLLNKLDLNDRITVFKDDVRYDYRVTEQKIVKSFDVSPLLDPVDKPVLTLQTCDPPGIPLNRLIIRAELEGVYQPNEEVTI